MTDAYDRGRACYDLDDYDGAIACFSEALRDDPQSKKAYNARGNAWSAKSDYDRAIADYNEALRIDPRYAVAYKNRGVAWYDKHDYDRAIADCKEALHLGHVSANTYLSLGRAYAAKGNYDGALQCYGLALSLDPKDADAHNDRGKAFAGKGDYEHAIADYDRALRLDPENANSYHHRAFARHNQGDYDRAIADFTEVLRLAPQNANALYNRGVVWHAKGYCERAFVDFEEALRVNPQHVRAHNGAALLLASAPTAAMRNGERAVDLARKAAELSNWNASDVLSTLAAAHAEAGNFVEAIRWQEKSLADAEFATSHGEDARQRLDLYRRGQPYREVMKKPQRENRWGARPANGGFAPERFPAFTIELVDRKESEGPGNVSSTDYRLVVSDGDASVEIETTNRRGPDLFEFRGQKYSYQVHEGDDGISYTVFPITVGPGGVWSGIPEQGSSLPWLPFELDGVRIDQDTDLPALVTRTLGGWTPPAARPSERETAARWALKLWSSLAGTGLEDEVAWAAGACLRSTDPLVRASALRLFDHVGQVPGSEVIEEVAAASDVDPLDAVPDPTHSSSTVPLGRSVRIGLSNRIRHLRKAGADPARALAIAKKLILQPGRADGLMTAVSESDWPWFEQHAEEIVKATPEVCCEVLYMLPRPDEEDMQEQGMLAARLASIPGIDAQELWMWAESFLSGDALVSVRAALDARGRSKWNFG